MTLQEQLDELRKYHEALGVKLASFERHLDPNHEDDIYDAVIDARADEVLKAPTMERQPVYAVSSDGSVMHVGRRYSFKYCGTPIANELLLKVTPGTVESETVLYNLAKITNVREVPAPQMNPDGSPSHLWSTKDGFTAHNIEIKLWEIVEFRTTEVQGPYQTGSIIPARISPTDEIHAVRRLTDGTIWRVGDKVNIGTYDVIQEVKKFWVDNISVMMCVTTTMIGQISALRKPEPLFTTADGVSLYDGDIVYGCQSNSGENLEHIINEFANGVLMENFWYSTHEAALAAYDTWLFEQPVLTLDDIVQDGFPMDYLETMKRIVEEKIQSK